jgi:protein-disulfide isomerase
MGKAAKQTARERLAEQRKRDAARARRNRTLAIMGAAVVVIIVVVVGGVMIAQSRDDSGEGGAYTGALAPLTVDPAASTVTMTKPGVTKPQVDVFEDFQCPACKQFEGSTGSVVRQLAAQGKAKVVYHVVSFINPIGSPRATAAAVCVPGNRWMGFHDALYAAQPVEQQDRGKSAFTVDQLAGIAAKTGLDAKTVGCVKKQAYAADAKANSEKASRAGISSTPTVMVDGKQVDGNAVYNRAALTKAITG